MALVPFERVASLAPGLGSSNLRINFRGSFKMFSKNAQHTAYSPFFYPLQQLNSTSLLAPLSLPAAEVRHSGIHPAERGAALYHVLAAPAQNEPVGRVRERRRQ